MLAKLGWAIVWTILPMLFGLDSSFVADTWAYVYRAEKEEDLNGSEKKMYVMNLMTENLKDRPGVNARVLNALLELAVVYMKR